MKHFYQVLAALTVTCWLIQSARASELAADSPAKEINAIEALLAKDQFDEARKFAKGAVTRDAQLTEVAAFVSVVVGQPKEALNYLASKQRGECGGLVDRKEELATADDFLFGHCVIHWMLLTRAKFGVKDWLGVIEAVEVLNLASKPNPIWSELILYLLARKISGLSSSSLDAATQEMIKYDPSSVYSNLEQIISNDTELLRFNNVRVDEFVIAVVGAAAYANLIKGSVSAPADMLKTLRLKVPVKLDGLNMDVGLLRALATTENAR